MSRSLERLARLPLALGATIGAGLFLYGRTIPAYSDIDAARQLKGPDACDSNGVVDGWHESLAALETMRNPLMQGGASLALAAISVWLILLVFRKSDASKVWTPTNPLTFFVLGACVLAISWQSSMFSIELDATRGEFPWCADSIGIPMMYLSTAYIMLFVVCSVVAAGIVFFFRDLPVPLFAWEESQRLRSWLISIPFFVIVLVIVLLALDGAILSTFFGTPAAVLALYMTEASRSALISNLSSELEFE